MSKDNLLKPEKVSMMLDKHREQLEELGVRGLRLFGSVARGEARQDSDLDFLVEFIEEPSLFELLEVQYFLEDLFGCDVDIGLEDSLKEEIKKSVLEELVYAF